MKPSTQTRPFLNTDKTLGRLAPWLVLTSSSAVSSVVSQSFSAGVSHLAFAGLSAR